MNQNSTDLMGVARLMRRAANGESLPDLFNHAAQNPDPANMLMGLSCAFQLLGNRDAALELQGKALAIGRIYRLPAEAAPPAIRLLALMRPGDMQDNTPLDFLLEASDVELILLYVSKEHPIPAEIPEHDLLFVAIGESCENAKLLAEIGERIETWQRPVINLPENIMRLSRDRASALLSSVEGLVVPIAKRMGRCELAEVAEGFPFILRPLDSHAGQDLEKLEAPRDIEDYLSRIGGEEFYLAKFMDYRSPDGLFRKYRIAMVDGRAHPCHMAISGEWMVNYRNSGMTESIGKRIEEEKFMTEFDTDFAMRHEAALREIHRRIGLDYFVVDCGELDGKLLLFELDNRAFVHDMDSREIFPYKGPVMRRLFTAFRSMLGKRC